MASQRVLDWTVTRFTGVTGSASIQFVPFDFSTHGLSNTCRCVIDVDCLALASTDHGATYSNQFIARVVFTWDPTTHGTIVKQVVDANDNTDIQWNLSASGTAGSFQVQAVGRGTTSTFSLCCAARIVSYVEY
ncbi:MAG TPA: hypothetical protein VMI54_03810 [Polyangiaceae bacterium]|nr:hypothetical protein [Polyangiaceae bacterium]